MFFMLFYVFYFYYFIVLWKTVHMYLGPVVCKKTMLTISTIHTRTILPTCPLKYAIYQTLNSCSLYWQKQHASASPSWLWICTFILALTRAKGVWKTSNCPCSRSPFFTKPILCPRKEQVLYKLFISFATRVARLMWATLETYEQKKKKKEKKILIDFMCFELIYHSCLHA